MNENIDLLKQHISIAAYYLAQRNHPYDTLCWMLAERQLYIQNQFTKPLTNDIKKKAAEIYYSSPDYDILCWLIAEKDVYLKSLGRRKETSPNFFG